MAALPKTRPLSTWRRVAALAPLLDGPCGPRVFILGVLLCCLGLPGCQKKADPGEVVPSAPTEAAASLPPLELRDETADLLLTWVDAQGDFHVVEKPADVPEEGRAQVRVVVASKREGTGQTIYVADLTQKNAAGSYPVSTMSRSAWNEIGAARRKVRLETALAPSNAPTAQLPEAPSAASVSATIYGASWCKPCHDAESFLKKLGVQVTKKDIEESRAARAEMQSKLAKAGQAGASIPVIDVAGQLFVGFNPGALKQAVKRAARTEHM